jgi:hypothetical protein
MTVARRGIPRCSAGLRERALRYVRSRRNGFAIAGLGQIDNSTRRITLISNQFSLRSRSRGRGRASSKPPSLQFEFQSLFGITLPRARATIPNLHRSCTVLVLRDRALEFV